MMYPSFGKVIVRVFFFALVICVICIVVIPRFLPSANIKQFMIRKIEGIVHKKITIEDIKINWLSHLRLSNVTIGDMRDRLESRFFIKVKDIELDYDLLSLLKKRLGRVVIDEPEVRFEGRPLQDMPNTNSVRPGLYPLNVVLRNARISKTDAPSFEIAKLDAEAINMSQEGAEKELAYYINLAAHSARYNIFNANNIRLDMLYTDNFLDVKRFEIGLYGGVVSGRCKIDIQDNVSSLVKSAVNRLDLKQLCNDNVPSKYKVTGIINGYLIINGGKNGIKGVRGKFISMNPGGTINSETFKMLTLNIPEGALKNAITALFAEKEDFIYNEGKIEIGLNNRGDVMLNLFIRGPKGKFSFDINIEKEVVKTFMKERYFAKPI